MVIVTWTAPGGTALAASLSSAATTDPLGNAVPAGLQGSIVAVEPASSPSVPEGWHTAAVPVSSPVWTGFVRHKKLAEQNMVCVDFQLDNTGYTAGANITAMTVPSAYCPATQHVLPFWMTTTANAWPDTMHLTVSTAGGVATSALPTSCTGIGGVLIFPLD